MKARAWWPEAVIVLLALVLRLAFLGEKPPHFDEGVNGWFVDSMTQSGFYHYDPGNFHGPLHFYVLFLSQTLFGRTILALRVPIVLVSTLCVVLTLAFRRFLPVRACRVAALAMAISPGCVFYGRYAIHESWLLLFLMLTVWGIAGLWKEGRAAYLWALGMGVTGMVLIKETYAVHLASLLLAIPTLLAVELITRSSPSPLAAQRWTRRDLRVVGLTALALILFFYTGALLDWSSLPGLWETFEKWRHTGTGGASGHEKSWHYFLELIGRYEWPAAAGMAAIAGLAWPGTNRLARFLAIYGLGALTAYSIIAYKTPWCVIVLLWPFYFIFGMGTDWLMERLDRWTAATGAALVCFFSLMASLSLNFRHATDDQEPYVYVQTLPSIYRLLGPLERLVARDPAALHLPCHMLTSDQHPLAWMLADFTRLDLLPVEEEPGSWNGSFLLIDESLVEKAEQELTGAYFKESLILRGNSNATEVLYLKADLFAPEFPSRVPEFHGPAQRTEPPADPPLEAPVEPPAP